MRRAAVALLVVPLALAACGGGKSTTTVKLTPLAAVRSAATKTAQVASQHMKLTGSVTVSGQAVTVSGSGDFEQDKGSLHLDFNAGGLAGTIDAVLQKTVLYLKSPLFADVLPKGKTWLKIDLAKVASAQGLDLSSLAAQSPAQTLELLKKLSNVREVGSEQIDGVDTTHYHGRITKAAGAGRASGPYDVWVGRDDGYVHRVKFSILVGSAQTLTATMDLSDFGKDVTVTVPSADETLDATNMKIPGLGG
jgi:hypothetical protein